MKFWRIYRLPGSRQIWHIDTGDNTPIINVRSFSMDGTCASSVDRGVGVPRAWIEVPYGSTELYIIQGVAVWRNVASNPSVHDAAEGEQQFKDSNSSTFRDIGE
jgi:hypothetical protein